MVRATNPDKGEISRREFCSGVVATAAVVSIPFAELSRPSINHTELDLENSAQTSRDTPPISIDTNMASIDKIMALPEIETLYAHTTDRHLENHRTLLSSIAELQPNWEVKFKANANEISLEIITDNDHFTMGKDISGKPGLTVYSSESGTDSHQPNLHSSQSLSFVWPSTAISKLDELKKCTADDPIFSKDLSMALLKTLSNDFIDPGSLS